MRVISFALTDVRILVPPINNSYNTKSDLFGVVKRYKAIHERSLTDGNAGAQGAELTDQVKVSSLIAL